MLFTDIIAVVIAITALIILQIVSIRKVAHLEKQNAWLRERVTSLRKQVAPVVEKDMSV